MDLHTQRVYASALLFFLAASCQTLNGAVIGAGNVEPDPESWDQATRGFIGRSEEGRLTIDDGSSLASESTHLGEEPGVSGVAAASGAGTQWINRQVMYVGNAGVGRLDIDTGAVVRSRKAWLGYEFNAAGSVTVTGPGSSYTIDDLLQVGVDGQGLMIIDQGGQLVSTTANLASAATAGGTVRVSGAGSQWNNEDRLSLGDLGIGVLSIDDGGHVRAGISYLGHQAGASGAATVKGSGSRWSSGSVHIGHEGFGELRVEAGASVHSREVFLGFDEAARGEAIITGADARWSVNQTFTIAESGSASVTMSDGAFVRGSGDVFIGRRNGSVGAATVAGSGTFWDIFGKIHVGSIGNGTLVVAAGSRVRNLDATIGNGKVEVSGAGTEWNARSIKLSERASGELVIRDGGVVTGAFANLAGGEALIEGNGSRWDTSMGMQVGAGAVESSSLVIRDGGTATAANVRISGFGGIEVRGSGSSLISEGELFVGYLGSNSLIAADGAFIKSSNASVGRASTGTASITGRGAKWETMYFHLGDDGTGSLTVADGGELEAGELHASISDIDGNGRIIAHGGFLDADIRFDDATADVAIVPFGSGGVLTVDRVTERLGIGRKSEGTLTVSNGVHVITEAGYVGNLTSTGAALVTGPGSRWQIESLSVGSGSLVVEAGGELVTMHASLGAAGNVVARIDGSGSRWVNQYRIATGSSKLPEHLILEVVNGGSIETSALAVRWEDLRGDGTITATAGAALNVDLFFDATHTHQEEFEFGEGGRLSVNYYDGHLGLGHFGQGRATITGGAHVVTADSVLARGSASRGVVAVEGSSTLWENSYTIYVGSGGVGRLSVRTGATVASHGISVDADSTLLVAGPDSRVELAGKLTTASDGGDIHIRNGGQLLSRSALIGEQSTLTMDMGRDSRISFSPPGSKLTNHGVVRLLAGPDAVATQAYFTAGVANWTGRGTLEAIGGTVNETHSRFIASEQVYGEAGKPVSLDLSLHQRVLIEEGTSQQTLGVSLKANADALAPATVLASTINPDQIHPLRPELVGAWEVAVSGVGYESGDPLYLSYGVNGQFAESALTVWQWSNQQWAPLVDPGFVVVAGFASFTVTEPGAYALTTAVPEPSSLAFAAVICGVIVWRQHSSLAR